MTLIRSSVFLVLLVLARLATAADAAGPTIIQVKSIALDTLTDQTRGSIEWSHGGFLFQNVSGGGPPTFYTLDREGQLISEATPVMPESGYVSVSSCDRRDDNSIVFIGQAWSAHGQPASLIGLISADGTTERIIRTAPYHPYMLSIAPDGTFWTLGLEMVDRDISAPGLDPKAGVLRHFDRSGKLLGASGPQSQFVKLYTTGRLDYGYLSSVNNRIGWYAPRSGAGGQYVEMDLDSMTPRTYPGLPELPELGLVVCFRLTESGNAFLSVYDNKSKHATTYMFNRETHKWLPLEGTVASQRPGPYLIGVDGEQLVFRDWKSNAMFFSLSR
ncbi:MAG TPA: hypothetical protein VMF91_00810 [Bryobacteraceae bacterium]|nr:hypothetical protein [Bryobacteraceae bacterium]